MIYKMPDRFVIYLLRGRVESVGLYEDEVTSDESGLKITGIDSEGGYMATILEIVSARDTVEFVRRLEKWRAVCDVMNS